MFIFHAINFMICAVLFCTASNFLHDTGTFIHFHDLFRNLDNYYFTNVEWVVKTIIFFVNFHHLYVDAGILFQSAGEAMFGQSIQNSDHFAAFMALLERMRVIFSISSKQRRRHLVTFALPAEKPAHEVCF